MKKYIFDIDGTLTPSRSQIDPDFRAFMLVFAIMLVLFQFIMSDRLVLTSMRAKVVSPDEAPELHQIVERLCAAAGIPKPKIAISEMQVPNALLRAAAKSTLPWR